MVIQPQLHGKILALVGMLAMAMCSCSSQFTAAQRAELNTVRIAPPVIAAQSYARPTGVAPSSQMAEDVGVGVGLTMLETGSAIAGSGEYVGAIGVPIAASGALIAATSWAAGEISDAHQQHSFETKHQSNLSTLNFQARFPPMLLVKANRSVIEGNAFFSTRIRSQSSNYFRCELTGYGLEKVGRNDQKQDLLRAKLEMKVSLVTGSGKTVFDEQYQGVSSSSYTVYQLINHDESIEKLYVEAVGQAMSGFEKDLYVKTRE